MKGATEIISSKFVKYFYFNPRSREGSDALTKWKSMSSIEFQSTLPWRERLANPINFNSPVLISIHAPVKGATKFKLDGIKFKTISIHAPVKGATV